MNVLPTEATRGMQTTRAIRQRGNQRKVLGNLGKFLDDADEKMLEGVKTVYEAPLQCLTTSRPSFPRPEQ